MYSDSSICSGGIKARVSRHLRLNKKLFWNIDYFLVNKNSKIKAVFSEITKVKREYTYAQWIFTNLSTAIPACKRFGSSDC